MAVSRVIIFALTLLSYAWVQANEDIIGDNDDIDGSTQVSIKEAPYMAALYRRGDEAFGSGSIIHEQFILTSASVVKNVSDFFHVLAGTDRLSAGGQLIEVDERLCHENFCGNSDSDICLLKLRAPLRLGPKVAKIDLPEIDSEFASGISLNVTGWGMIEDHTYPDHLRRTMVALRDSGMCSYYYNVTMTDNMICAGTPDNGPCVGDGGAPLTYDNMQVGVASFGAKDACGRFPTVFTKVSKFVFWIEETILNNL